MLGGRRISTRLLVIAATCLLPLVALQVAVGVAQWSERKAQMDGLAAQQAGLLKGNADGIAEGARILLAAAAIPEVRGSGEECAGRLAKLSGGAPGFAFVALVDSGGRIVCASDPAIAAGGGAEERWVRDALAAPGFTAGRFARPAGHPGGVLPFYLPLGADDAAAPMATLVAALDLDWLEHHLKGLKHAGSPLLANGVLTVADADGVILGRDTRHAEFVGGSFPPAAMPMVSAAEPGTLRLRSIDGTDRLVGYTPPTPANHRLAAVVGFHEPELMADVERALWRAAALLGAVGLVAFCLTLWVACCAIARPTRNLLAVAKRWREGDLAARAPECAGRSEFGQIAAAYNEMAAALQRREEEARSYTEALEARVAERTRELVEANNRLQLEIAERRNAEAALLQAQKVQAMGQLAGGIAHDFNNILQAVSGGAILIRRRAGDAAAVERLAGMIEDAARRGQAVTRRLLAFSRREELRADALDLGGLLRGLREVLAATLGAKIRVEVDAEADLSPVLADRGQLETVLVNLATNARDAMPDGGMVVFSASAERVEDAAGAPAGGLAPGDYVRLMVADTGEGMDAATLARATEPFFTTKPLGQGTGLGLAMARGFAEGSGGSLTVASEPGRGTRVSLWLPVVMDGGSHRVREAAAEHRPAPPRAAGTAAATAAAPAGRPRVLLVDDEAVVREVLAAQLRDEGFDVLEAAEGFAALALLDRGEALDAMVTDLAMPGLPVILLTGYVADAAALSLGSGEGSASALVRKPITGAELADQVAMLLHPHDNQLQTIG
ncbi:MAG: HAMP domain-containing protein [Acetobacteraceae bacterium]|nr:HAMP domain-containing protein [Acetobacteraceae bacterium]